jgi:hypothetical protein
MQKSVTMMALAALSLFFAGCMYVNPHVSSMNFSPETMELLGPAMGKSSQKYFLCLIPEGEYSLMAAMREAINFRQGDALINTCAEHETFVGPLGLWCTHAITVTGTVVKFKRPQQRSAQDSKPDDGATLYGEALTLYKNSVAAAAKYCQSLSEPEKYKIEDFVRTNNKGQVELFDSKKFHAADALPPKEAEFVMWFMSTYFGYDIKSAQSPEPVPAASTTTANGLPGSRVQDGNVELVPPSTK